MTYPIVNEINQYIKQICDVKTSIRKKLNYEFFYSFNFVISCIICKILFIFSSKITKAYITIYECIHFVKQIYIVSSWSQGLPLQEKIYGYIPSCGTHQQCFLLTMCCAHPSLFDLCEYIILVTPFTSRTPRSPTCQDNLRKLKVRQKSILKPACYSSLCAYYFDQPRLTSFICNSIYYIKQLQGTNFP